MTTATIGVIGLAVMGQNLVLNMERNGYTVAVFNRTTAVTEEFIAAHPGKKLVPSRTLEEFVASLETPRRILIMVKAGAAVDAVIDGLVPLLDKGDLIMDGGNSFYADTDRRSQALALQGLNYMGVGVSGGEEGALWGPSIMPGGTPEAWSLVSDLLQDIAAKAPEDGKPCVAFLGPRSAGHYVKMVHNGIEYGDMQLIAEAYNILRQALGLEAAELADDLRGVERGRARQLSHLDYSPDFRRIDDLTGKPLVDLVLDTAQQKGTGKWTSQDSFEHRRRRTHDQYGGCRAHSFGMKTNVWPRVVVAGAAARPMRAARRFDRRRRASALCLQDQRLCPRHGDAAHRQSRVRYGLNLGDVASLWRAGCIIRARFLNRITEAFVRNADLPNLLLDEPFNQSVAERLHGMALCRAYGGRPWHSGAGL